MRVARIAVPLPRGNTYDYLLRDDDDVSIGTRVIVPFGSRRVVGVIIALAESSEMPVARLKAVHAVCEQMPLWDVDYVDWLQTVARYYHAPLGQLTALALPRRLRSIDGDEPSPQREIYWRLLVSLTDAQQSLRANAVKQRAVVAALAEGVCDEKTLRTNTGTDSATLATLHRRGIIGEADAPSQPVRMVTLTTAQQAVVDRVLAADGFLPLYLEGETGSGKTEVYLALIKQVVAAGKQALVLLPEIGLTPQMATRFRSALPCDVVVLHSGVSDAEQARLARAAASGEVMVVLGTRSAVFTPFRALGLMVVDEAHDASYKQYDTVPYNACRVALLRAQRLQIPIVMGSATPTLDDMYNIERGVFRHARLRRRHRVSSSPVTVQILDMRVVPQSVLLPPPTLEAIRDHLDDNGQVMLFLNRRGYAPVLHCADCRRTAYCDQCHSALVFHRRKKVLACHICERTQPLYQRCPSCGSRALQLLGYGTERLAEELQLLFPQAEICRVDRDTMTTKSALETTIARITSGEPMLIVGTQMLAKGHDFSELTLACILDTDFAYQRLQLRAQERCAQLLTQVCGRVGRGQRPATIIVQTRQPEHPLLQTVLNDGYRAFAERLLIERRELGLPPYSYAALIRATHTDERVAYETLRQLQTIVDAQTASLDLSWEAPQPLPLARVAGRYRIGLLCAHHKRSVLHQAASVIRRAVEQLHNAHGVRLLLDIDAHEHES